MKVSKVVGNSKKVILVGASIPNLFATKTLNSKKFKVYNYDVLDTNNCFSGNSLSTSIEKVKQLIVEIEFNELSMIYT